MIGAEREWLMSAVAPSVRAFYDAVGVQLPNTEGMEASVRCFANASAHKREDRDPSCSVNLLTGLWKCHGCGESGNPFSAAVALGHSERRAGELARQYGVFLELAKDDENPKPRLPTERHLRKWRERLHASPRVLARLWELKGWTPQAIVRCGLGWDGERLVFPIRDKKLKLQGVVRYVPGGSPKSLALPGTKRGLFPAPESLSYRRPVFLVEGEPDAVSVRSCGHQAVAVPGTGGWRPEFASRLAGRRLIALADCDSQGRDLAYRVASVLPKVTVVDLEPRRDDGSDIGDWIAGAARDGGLRQMQRVLGRLAA